MSAILALASGVARKVPLWVWPLIAIALLAGLQTLRLEHARTSTAQLQAEFADYQKRIAAQAAADQQKASDAFKAWQAMSDAAAAARIVRLQRENADLNQRLMEISNAPPEQDGPVADVLCASFSRLWHAPACTADRRH